MGYNGAMGSTTDHWENVYGTKDSADVSWFEPEPTMSLAMIDRVAGPGDSVIDIGAGASFLVDRLVARGHTDVTVLDVSSRALDAVRGRFAGAGVEPGFVVADVTMWRPARTWDLWHDRAVFHFMVTPEMRAGYARAMSAAVRPSGHAIVATFAPDGPEQCSGITVARYGADELAAEFSDAFDPVDSARDVHTTPWGAQQQFTWVVLRRR